jgi:DNA polymerase III epsilon subunit-like protein
MYLFIDTETNGLPRRFDGSWSDTENWPRMVELAWLLCDGQGDEIDGWCGIIRPEGYLIPQEASDVHGITTETALQEGVGLDLALQGLITACNRADYLVGHNVDFDAGVIAAEMSRCGFRLSSLDLAMTCTMKSSANFCRLPGKYGGYKWPSLSELHHILFGCNPSVTHRGRDDVHTCARCFYALKERGVIQ